MTQREMIRELAGLVAAIIRRMGASYGSSEDWRRDFTQAVKIEEAISREMQAIKETPGPIAVCLTCTEIYKDQSQAIWHPDGIAQHRRAGHKVKVTGEEPEESKVTR